MKKRKKFAKTSCTTRIGNSTGVSPSLWMGSIGGKGSGFEQLRIRNGSVLTPRAAHDWALIKLDEASRVASRAVINGADSAVSLRVALSGRERLQRRLGLLA